MFNLLIFFGKIALAVLPVLALLKLFGGKRASVKGRIIEGEIVEESKNKEEISK